MDNQPTTYNERSWAIDLISEINLWAKDKDISIKRAGGESTLKTKIGSLFPDVLLYGDQADGLILQGWELKMPDTAINDKELLDNAVIKAQSLGLNSFLVWNVTTAVLYLIDGSAIKELKTWNDLSHITSRKDVLQNRDIINEQLHIILKDLNQFFVDGSIKPSRFVDAITGDRVINMLLSNISVYAENLHKASLSDSQFEDEVNLWWLISKLEYPDENNKWKVLARNNLITTFNKFVFAHALKHFNSKANLVDTIDEDTNVADGLEIFVEISSTVDFWNVFSRNLGDEFIPNSSWNNFQILNSLLKDFDIENVDTKLIHDLLDNLVMRSKRKIAGQFATPKPLANLLARLVIKDHEQTAIDPCCGSGTIAKAILRFKGR